MLPGKVREAAREREGGCKGEQGTLLRKVRDTARKADKVWWHQLF